MDFKMNTAGYVFRPLRLYRNPNRKQMRGWDVYALQTALVGLDYDLPVSGHDGWYGGETKAVVKDFQTDHALVVDGIAGGDTQRKIAGFYVSDFEGQLPQGLAYGQCEKESSLLPGNHSLQYSDGSWDCGIMQRNDRYTTKSSAFSVPQSMQVYKDWINQAFVLYQSFGKVTSERRLWELAAGSWNRPAWTERLARGYTLTPGESAWIEAYIDRVTTYMVV